MPKYLEGTMQVVMLLLVAVDAILAFLVSASFFCTLKQKHYRYEDHAADLSGAGAVHGGLGPEEEQHVVLQGTNYVCTYYSFALIQLLYPFALVVTPFLGFVAVLLSDTRLGRLYGEYCLISLLNALLAFLISVHAEAHVLLCLGLLVVKMGEVVLVDHWVAQIECRRGLRGWTRVYRYQSHFKQIQQSPSTINKMSASNYGAV